MKLSQETIAIVSVGLTLLGTVLYTSARIEDRIVRIEETARADRAAFETRARADREAFEAAARADREAWTTEVRRLDAQDRADREAFEAQILRLTEGQSRLSGTVEALRTASQ